MHGPPPAPTLAVCTAFITVVFAVAGSLSTLWTQIISAPRRGAMFDIACSLLASLPFDDVFNCSACSE
ncbi:hypothetical protein GUJ93_ZPchr0005g16345 [Zizania palustris]|uniref:Uncharacterized protein n=1 Tax=Zizania palustris TaxID=103762 RepID=A0A8J5SM06_ZIZPA|nr:hypothetical protein GUJ93_ZPchr0005g16345 [Zizania palustris]